MSQEDPTDEFRVKAARIAASASLRDLRLTASDFELFAAPTPGQPLDVKMDIELTGGATDQENALAVTATFTLEFGTAEDVVEDRTSIAHLRFTYASVFHVNQGCEWDDEALEAFAQSTGIFAIYPYAREYVTDVTNRIGLPPLVLDFLKY